ncbi:MAG: molybdopterin-dependent oxidoreductase [Gammaproteobacteria bacterium]|nr:molybdopterin-dependent oxidoreductase [Gammaproteobacteria bacterium]
MTKKSLPPRQREIGSILQWNIDHPGIKSSNPTFDPKTWRMKIIGKIIKTMDLTWNEFLKLPTHEAEIDFHCVEGWSIIGAKWKGVSMSTLIQLVNPSNDVRYVLFSCTDGYTTSLSMQELIQKNALLAYELNDELLPIPLGGPVRLIVSDKYAYKNAMWVNEIIFSPTDSLGYWEKKGYSNTANVWEDDRNSR